MGSSQATGQRRRVGLWCSKPLPHRRIRPVHWPDRLLLIAAALVNILIANVGPRRRLALWRAEVSGGVKVCALVSLLLWLSTIRAGRLIAYF
jgi:hypothetical protein